MDLSILVWLAICGGSCYLVVDGLKRHVRWRRGVGAFGFLGGLNGLAFAAVSHLRTEVSLLTLTRLVTVAYLLGLTWSWGYLILMRSRRKKYRTLAGRVLLSIRPTRQENALCVLQIGLIAFCLALGAVSLWLLSDVNPGVVQLIPLGTVLFLIPTLFHLRVQATVAEHGLVDNITYIPWSHITGFAWNAREGPSLTLSFKSESAFGGRRLEPAGTHRWPVRLEQVEELQGVLEQRRHSHELDPMDPQDDPLAKEIEALGT